jgi:hypothetical protein
VYDPSPWSDPNAWLALVIVLVPFVAIFTAATIAIIKVKRRLLPEDRTFVESLSDVWRADD